jgi:hypothetical protein
MASRSEPPATVRRQVTVVGPQNPNGRDGQASGAKCRPTLPGVARPARPPQLRGPAGPGPSRGLAAVAAHHRAEEPEAR